MSIQNWTGKQLEKFLLGATAVFQSTLETQRILLASYCVPADMPLCDILNEFQKGSSHMAVVVKAKGKSKNPVLASDGEKAEENKVVSGEATLTTPLLSMPEGKSESGVVDIEKEKNRHVNMNRPPSLQQNDASNIVMSLSTEDVEDGEVIGIITLEDVFEELLQEEIVDETDEYVDVHKRICVAAAAAASSVARAPSYRRLAGQKGGQNWQGQHQPSTTPKKPADDDSNSTRIQVSFAEPLPGTKR